ncbi:MAG: AraC family transcriptional regulator [Verrucomicrobiota bacterium]
MPDSARLSPSPAGKGGDVGEHLDAFFATVPVSEILRPFDGLPGVFYVIKDLESRVMAISPQSVERMGFRHEHEIIGKRQDEYLPPELALKFRADDEWVIRHGKPRLNLVEMWFSAGGKRDWIVTNKYPLLDRGGQVAGIIGILQNLDIRERRFAHLGPVGKAADHIRFHYGEPLRVGDIARLAGFSERQLQRIFREVFGQTIQQYLIEIRLHAAIDRLTHSGLTISEIALQVGFNDQSAFSNRFKRFTGQSPHAYRARALRER